MKYPWAVPGAKVVCVDGSNHRNGHSPKYGFPTRGTTYTISQVAVDPWGRGIRVILMELPNPWVEDESFDGGWGITRFRPLRTVEDDVALFAHHLTPAPTDLTVA